MAARGVARSALGEGFAAFSALFPAGSGTPSAAWTGGCGAARLVFAGGFGVPRWEAGSVFICPFFLSSRGLDHEPSTYIRAVRNGFFEKKLKNPLGRYFSGIPGPGGGPSGPFVIVLITVFIFVGLRREGSNTSPLLI